MENNQMSFWEHLDELRKIIFRCAILLVILMVVAFCLKKPLFDAIFAPLSSDFSLYRLFNRLLALMHLPAIEPFDIQLMNIDMVAQFFTHLRVSLFAALVVGMPFIFHQLWSFVRPALYSHEKKLVKNAFAFAGILFYVGVLTSYFIVVPLTVRFLGTYQVSPDVPNQIALNSYIGMFVSLLLVMGIVFEMPILAILLSKIGIINKEMMQEYRKHAIVVLLIAAAVITPSGDAVTLFFVAIPLYLLYEFSIVVCKKASVSTD
ncbi:MAG: twin-arginine translocase subunit TatC [Bacteroidales bacterium]|nr:twin-arginine translocase subunit TatC [Bacteroidales bacterium]